MWEFWFFFFSSNSTVPARKAAHSRGEETVLDLGGVAESSQVPDGVGEVAGVLLFMTSPRVTGPERGEVSLCPHQLPHPTAVCKNWELKG